MINPEPANEPMAAVHPQGRGGGEPADRKPIPDNHATGQESDPARYLTSNTSRAAFIVEQTGQRNEQGRAEGDQSVGAQPGLVAPKFPLQPNQ